MQKIHIEKAVEREDFDSPVIPSSISLVNNKISPYSVSKFSEISISEEDTSHIFKNHENRMCIQQRQDPPKFEIDLSSIHSSPTKSFSTHITELKYQIVKLANKFSNHQSDLNTLTGENIQLQSRIIKLQESIISLTENSMQDKSKCNCNLF